ncbi:MULTISPECIES: hypothetical protein [Terrabacteria group]|uniref:hypothetical protein n=1 Tax=Bacillati TaxID=1783272 RepID=UPI001C6E1367|nr:MULTISPECIES: hypothetical protein [Terrabacteria group]MBW9213116.1 hypothetical protein [Trueperella sp. zg.1013]
MKTRRLEFRLSENEYNKFSYLTEQLKKSNTALFQEMLSSYYLKYEDKSNENVLDNDTKKEIHEIYCLLKKMEKLV